MLFGFDDFQSSSDNLIDKCHKLVAIWGTDFILISKMNNDKNFYHMSKACDLDHVFKVGTKKIQIQNLKVSQTVIFGLKYFQHE